MLFLQLIGTNAFISRPSNNQAASSTAAYSDQSDENTGNEPNFTQEIRQMIADEDDRNVSFHRYLSL